MINPKRVKQKERRKFEDGRHQCRNDDKGLVNETWVSFTHLCFDTVHTANLTLPN